MSEFAITGNESCLHGVQAAAADETLQMDEDRFRAFYERTSRQLWGYLSRVAGDPSAADDLLQETYYRLLRVRLPEMGEVQLKSYLYRIASNLMRDDWRREKHAPVQLPSDSEGRDPETPHCGAAEDVERRSELALAFRHLNRRERELLWLAYAEGSSHKEIAELQGLRPDSIRQLLFRARKKLASLIRGSRPGGGHPKR